MPTAGKVQGLNRSLSEPRSDNLGRTVSTKPLRVSNAQVNDGSVVSSQNTACPTFHRGCASVGGLGPLPVPQLHDGTIRYQEAPHIVITNHRPTFRACGRVCWTILGVR